MHYGREILKILNTTYALNTKILEEQNTDLMRNKQFSNLFEAYWISNIKIKNAIELLEILENEES